MSAPEVWLRGAVPGIAPALQPAAHALLQIREELEALLVPLTVAEAHHVLPGAPSAAFHARHLAGSTDRLCTYARGEALNALQLARLAAETEPTLPPPDGRTLWLEVAHAIDAALRELHVWSATPERLGEHRAVGRAQLPSTVLGLLFHAAEHAQRHAGQLATTVRVARALREQAVSA